MNQQKSFGSSGQERCQNDGGIRRRFRHISKVVQRCGVGKVLFHSLVLVERDHSTFAIGRVIIEDEGLEALLRPDILQLQYGAEHPHRWAVEIDTPLFLVEVPMNMPSQHVSRLER